jgi:hypothetical protein
MKPRHAVALALVGWYLMVPLPGHAPIPNANIHTFSNWVHIASFDSAAECEHAKMGVTRMGVAGPQLGGYPDWEVTRVLLLSQCVASDDPRLKEK